MPALKAFIELLKGFARSWLVRRAQKNIAVSDHVVRRIALPSTVRIYHGITVPESVGLFPSTARATEKICFAFVGRFVPEKGIPVLLEACSFLAAENLDFQVRLIGDGPIRPELDASIQSKNLRQYVSITGYLSGAQLAEALRDVAVVVMPSIWEETAGLSAIEQMFRGRLVIASDIAGLAEMVADAGLLFPAGDPKALAACMRSVIVNPAQIDSLGKKARARALQLFPQDRMVKQHFELYRDVASRTSRSDNLLILPECIKSAPINRPPSQLRARLTSWLPKSMNWPLNTTAAHRGTRPYFPEVTPAKTLAAVRPRGTFAFGAHL